ncbi:MAG TPA: ribonuclease E/G, partial [Citricoccus sp.]
MAANERDTAESTDAVEAAPPAAALETPEPDGSSGAATDGATDPGPEPAQSGSTGAAALETPDADAAEQQAPASQPPVDPEAPADTATPEVTRADAGEDTEVGATAQDDMDDVEEHSGEGAQDTAQPDPFAVPSDPLALIFQAPDLSTIPPAPARRKDRQDADDAEDTRDREDDENGEDRSEDTEGRSSGARRSRRRRGRGRTSGSADGGQGGSGDEGEAGQGQEAAGSPGEAAQEEDSTEGQSGQDGNGEGSGTRRRRRRRRGTVDMELEGGADDDPENTVTRVRAPRQAGTTGPQGVTSLKGSTRLEAKRQRRRESRSGGRQRRHVITEAEFLARRESVDRKMLVRQREQRIQIAVMEDGVLAEHFVSNTTQDSMIGNVYLGKVQNVLPSMEAAFVDIGRGRNAVLYAGEVNWDAANLEGKGRKIENALKSGDSVLVQVTKDPVGHKGARLTSQISLPGRYLVYVPGGSMTGISRKLPDVERSRLKKILKDHLPENAGVIVRTAAEGTSEQELMN